MLCGVNAKQPIIRKGQRKPYVKATQKQIEQRVEAAALLSFCGFDKAQIHHIFRKRYGVEWRQTDRYMTRARAENTRSFAWRMGTQSTTSIAAISCKTAACEIECRSQPAAQ
jgi:hypothetical protein